MAFNANRCQQILLELLAIPCPCGFTDEVVHYIANHLKHVGVKYDITRRGTIRAKLPGGSDASQRQARAIVAHTDTIGAMVSRIKPSGRLALVPIGYWSSRFAEGVRVNVFSEKGAFRGTVLPVLDWGVTRDSGVDGVPVAWENVELRIDELVSSSDDVRELGIDVGDPVVLDGSPEFLSNGFIVGRHLDNKAGVALVLELLYQLKEAGETPFEDTFVLFTITETVGAGTGSAVLPEVSELVTVDFASVRPECSVMHQHITIASADAGGPFDYHLTAHLKALAEAEKLPHHKIVLPAFHNDAASTIAAGHDVRTALLAYTGDASHSLERVHMDALANMTHLLRVYVRSAPTFTSDTELTTAEAFSHQISRVNLPPSPTPVPDMADVIQVKKVMRDDAAD
ncbi:MAG: osmoprotectant NAGGN system M42 family peptidase [Gammaproteobacteria bacterium]